MYIPTAVVFSRAESDIPTIGFRVSMKYDFSDVAAVPARAVQAVSATTRNSAAPTPHPIRFSIELASA